MLKPILFAAALAATATAAAATDLEALTEAERQALRSEIRDYLITNPELLLEVIAILEQRKAEEAEAHDALLVAQNLDALLNDGHSFVGGNPDGDVTIVEFIDYQCGYCKRAHPEVAELLSSDGNIRLIQKEFPILGPLSETASRAAIAVLKEDGRDVYEDFSDKLMRFEGRLSEAIIERLATDSGVDVARMKTRMAEDDVTRVIGENRALAQALEISGTPTFVLGDEMIRGYVPLASMRERVEALRATN